MAKADPQKSEIVLYQTEDDRTRLEVKLEDETVWLTQGQMAELFQITIPNVSMHIRNLFSEGELKPDSVVKESLTTAADGKNYATRFYNRAFNSGEFAIIRSQAGEPTPVLIPSNSTGFGTSANAISRG